MENDKEEKKIPPLPPIRSDDDVSDDEPQVSIGKRKASLPPPVLFIPKEK